MRDLPSEHPETLTLREWYAWFRSFGDTATDAIISARANHGLTAAEIRKHWASIWLRISRETVTNYASGEWENLSKQPTFMGFLSKKKPHRKSAPTRFWDLFCVMPEQYAPSH